MKDWRKDYVICAHVTKDSEDTRHQMFRVCCEKCYQNGFLTDEHLRVKEIDGLSIGSFESLEEIISENMSQLL